ncbi:MAG: lysophospholipid acyltransferase family protein, partial [Edaphobacter sp.]
CGAVISNHMGYLDIVVYAALHPCVFVSKAEIQAVPVLGWMTTMAGTVYVERGHGGSAVKARSGMQAAADACLPVVFFPEGTTTNGNGLLKFHSGLLAQAMQSGMPVTAAYMRHSLPEGSSDGGRRCLLLGRRKDAAAYLPFPRVTWGAGGGAVCGGGDSVFERCDAPEDGGAGGTGGCDGSGQAEPVRGDSVAICR